MLVIRAGIHKIENREDPDQIASLEAMQSDLGLLCLPRPFVKTFRTFTIFNWPFRILNVAGLRPNKK